MRNEVKLKYVALTSGFALCAVLSVRPARADHLVAVADERGRLIYINDDTHQPGVIGRSGFGFSSFGAAAFTPQIGRLIDQSSARFELDPDLLHAIIQVESAYNPRALSPKGAMGLMQLMPATARRFGVRNPFDAKQNVEGGATYLNHLLKLFSGDVPRTLAAYNAGEQSVLRDGGIPPINETQNYVRKVTALYQPESHVGIREASKASDDRKRVSALGSAESRVEAAPMYSYVDARGVTHFEQ